MRWAVVVLALVLTGCVQLDPKALSPGKGGIEGVIVETQDSRAMAQGPPAPIADANILVYRLGQPVATAKSDQDGAFFIRDLTPANYEVRAGKEGYDVPSQGVKVSAGVYTRADFEGHPMG